MYNDNYVGKGEISFRKDSKRDAYNKPESPDHLYPAYLQLAVGIRCLERIEGC